MKLHIEYYYNVTIKNSCVIVMQFFDRLYELVVYRYVFLFSVTDDCKRHCINKWMACPPASDMTLTTVRCLLLAIYLSGLVYSTSATMAWRHGFSIHLTW